MPDMDHHVPQIVSGIAITGTEFLDDNPARAIGRESLDFTRAVPLVNPTD